MSKLKTKLQQITNPDLRKTIVDEKGDELFKLNDEELELLMRINNHQFPSITSDMEFAVEFPYDSVYPVTNRPTPKSSFIPSKHEAKRINELVQKIKRGDFDQLKKKINEDDVFHLWPEDTDPETFKRKSKKIPPPRMHLPGHAESYNPPAEYLFTDDEKKEWDDTDPADRKIDFVPQKHDFFLYDFYFFLDMIVFVMFLDMEEQCVIIINGVLIFSFSPE
jgi:ribosome biogenesis protein ERB1